MTRAVARLLAVLLGLVAFVATSPAAGYCRKTTSSVAVETSDPARTGRCEPAPESALPLYWAKTCVAYRIVVDPALEARQAMTAARAAVIVHRAAAAWGSVQCASAAGGTRPVAIQTVDVAQGGCPGGSGSARTEVRFTTEPSDGDALAITDMTFDAQSGGLFSAVTRVSDVYAELGATAAETDAHLEYVVRHEIGHALGLAHSETSEAVMNATFRTRATDALEDDDVRGICDAYDPDAPVGAGCTVARDGDGAGGAAWAAVLAALTLLGAVRRRMAVRWVAVLSAVVLMTAGHHAHASPKPAKPTKKRSAPRPAAPPAEPTDEELLRRKPTTIPIAPTTTAAESSVSGVLPTTAPPTVATVAEPDVAPPSRASTELYVGGGYRAFVLPRALLGAFGRANADPIFHAVSAEATFRGKNGFSVVPALTFAELSTGDMLVGSRSAERASAFSYVRSDLRALAASVELVWSLPVSRALDLELGLELGVGVTFGTLVDNWVYESADGRLEYGGRRFAPCRTVNDGVGCRPQDHGSPTPVRVGDYAERSMFAGGSAPTLLPWVSLPLAGVRVRVSDDVALRVGVGASATGIWAGASLGYAVTHREP